MARPPTGGKTHLVYGLAVCGFGISSQMKGEREMQPTTEQVMSHDFVGSYGMNISPPVRTFRHPMDVVNEPTLTIGEKRALLASWASDRCAVEAAPSLRRIPGSWQIVHIDEILEALRELDEQAGDNVTSWARRQVRRASIEAFRARCMEPTNHCGIHRRV